MSLFWKKRKQQTQDTVKTTENKQATVEQSVVEYKQVTIERKEAVANTQNTVSQTITERKQVTTEQQPKQISMQSQTTNLYENWPKHIEKVYPSGQKVVE